jgi:tRNA pseudouridine55 synthase
MSEGHSMEPNVSGMFLVDKPKGLTSHDVVARIRKVGNFSRVGHGGTLDPMATGILPVFIGRSTRLSEMLHAWSKTYKFEVTFGVTTDTGDAEGNIISENEAMGIDLEAIEKVLPSFRGRLMQKPPMFSAVKRDGVPLHRLARKGIEVEREPREIEIFELNLLRVEEKRAWFTAHCSKGTYIRTLAQDIGDAIGVGGHVSVLERSGYGRFSIADKKTVSLENLLERLQDESYDSLLITPGEIFQGLPEIRVFDAHLPSVFRGAILAGFQVYHSGGLFNFSDTVRICDRKGKFLALGLGLVSSADLSVQPKGLPVARVEKVVGAL